MYDITYQPRTTIKLQVLADFVADFSANILLEAEKETLIAFEVVSRTWTLYIDGSSNLKGSVLEILVITSIGETVQESIKCPLITNNEAEYEAVVAGLGTYVARETQMQQYLARVTQLLSQFQEWKAT